MSFVSFFVNNCKRVREIAILFLFLTRASLSKWEFRLYSLFSVASNLYTLTQNPSYLYPLLFRLSLPHPYLSVVLSLLFQPLDLFLVFYFHFLSFPFPCLNPFLAQDKFSFFSLSSHFLTFRSSLFAFSSLSILLGVYFTFVFFRVSSFLYVLLWRNLL